MVNSLAQTLLIIGAELGMAGFLIVTIDGDAQGGPVVGTSDSA